MGNNSTNATKIIIEDSPINNLSEDLLGRERIVKSISETIKYKSETVHPCYTIGIYGKWGEGKTSVLNMVKGELEKEENINVVEFNPWLFKDQESFLLDFFKAFERGNSKEVVEKIKQYGPLVSLGISGLLNIAMPGLGNIVGKSLKKITNAVSKIDIDIRQLKKELNESIRLSGKHLLILIDDVDRLDKEELHALFKLIRQNADFVNTTYLIAMDVDMVAKSIGQRFESGDEQSGRHFLEKIIQVPIYLPKIQRMYLQRFCESHLFFSLETLLSQGGRTTTSIETVKETFYNYLFPLFSTVREIILYANALSFTLPSIYREVNLSDLFLLEALKLFQLDAYEQIKNNKHLITGTISKISSNYLLDSPEKRQARKDTFLESIRKKINSRQFIFIDKIINEILYPFSLETYDQVKLSNEKRLCSDFYFDKYFLYAVPNDILSDVEYDELIETISVKDENDLTNIFDSYHKRYGYKQLQRIISQMLYMRYSYNIDNDCIGKICMALSRLSINKERKEYIDFRLGVYPEFTICDIIDRYIIDMDNMGTTYERVIPNRDKQLDIFSKILSTEKLEPFHLFFATHFCDKSSTYYAISNKTDKIVHGLIIRYIEKRGIKQIFELGQTPITVLFKIWRGVAPEEYHQKIDTYLTEEDFNIVSFVRRMITRAEPESYDKFCKLFDKNTVFNRIKDVDANSIPDYYNSVGFFIERYNSKEDASK